MARLRHVRFRDYARNASPAHVLRRTAQLRFDIDSSITSNNSQKYWFLPLRQIDHDRIARLHQILRRDHDLLAPLTRACAEDGFVEQSRFEEGAESAGLPAERGNRTDHVSRRLFHRVRRYCASRLPSSNFQRSRSGRRRASRERARPYPFERSTFSPPAVQRIQAREPRSPRPFRFREKNRAPRMECFVRRDKYVEEVS